MSLPQDGDDLIWQTGAGDHFDDDLMDFLNRDLAHSGYGEFGQSLFANEDQDVQSEGPGESHLQQEQIDPALTDVQPEGLQITKNTEWDSMVSRLSDSPCSATVAPLHASNLTLSNVVPAQKDSYFDCISCGYHQKLNGKNNGELCTRCYNRTLKSLAARNAPSPTRPSSARSDRPATMTTSRSSPGDVSHVPTERKRFDRRFATVNDARNFIEGQDYKDCESLQLFYDDAEDCESNLPSYYDRLLSAVQEHPTPAPPNFSEVDAQFYNTNQAKKMDQVRSMLQSEESVTLASARIIVLADAVLKIHKIGIPTVLTQKRHRGIDADRALTCSTRFEEVIRVAKSNKNIAVDILNGTNLCQLAGNPAEYLKRKQHNAASNAARSLGNKIVDKSVRGESCDDILDTIRNRRNSQAKGKSIRNVSSDCSAQSSVNSQFNQLQRNIQSIGQNQPIFPQESNNGVSTQTGQQFTARKRTQREEDAAEYEQYPSHKLRKCD